MRSDRRQWLRDTWMTATAVSLVAATAETSRAFATESDIAESPTTPPLGPMVDTNVHVGSWPFRHLTDSDPRSLVTKLRRLGFTQAWASSFDAILHRDLSDVNSRLASTCREVGAGFLVPFGAINPSLPDWEEDLRRCHEVHQMPGLRIYPGYHDYRLDEPVFRRLLEQTVARGLLLQLVVALEDTRTQHPRVRAEDVDLSPLPELLKGLPRARILLLGGRPAGNRFDEFADDPRVRFDTSRIDGTDGIAAWVRRTSPSRVMLGSHSPMLITQANLIKLYESDLTDAELLQISGIAASEWLTS